jgi:hypothetical protein
MDQLIDVVVVAVVAVYLRCSQQEPAGWSRQATAKWSPGLQPHDVGMPAATVTA